MTDFDRFRLRRFVEQLDALGEVDAIKAATTLGDAARHLEGNPRAVWLRAVGPERSELVGNVMASRRRIAEALGVDEPDVRAEVVRRVRLPVTPHEVVGAEAPCQEVVLTGDEADLLTLPIHLQHEHDGGLYISAAMDVSRALGSTRTNLGVRRLMIRGPRETGVDLLSPSDLRAAYQDAVAAGEPLPVSFVIGSHPVDYIAATALTPPLDELEVMGGLRQSPVPVVRCVTNDLLVPADAEIVLEGYLDRRGYTEPEGPYGEYLGYYGGVKVNPVFHVTAITRRHDALFQTATISGRSLAVTDTAQLVSLRAEVGVWAAVEQAIREPVAVHAAPASGGFNVRVSMRPRYPGEARNAIAAAFACHADVKHVFVTDEDIDVSSDAEVEWALATRFQADRDLIVDAGFRAMPLDPSLAGRTGAKVGFDLTLPFGDGGREELVIPRAPVFEASGTPKTASVEEALAAGITTLIELMRATRSTDGRDVMAALHDLDVQGRLIRPASGGYALAPPSAGTT